jgi:Mg2+ and Co2+ transporter CorA
MEVYSISAAGLKVQAPADMSALLSEPELIVWVDISQCGPDQAQILDDWFGFHPLALRDCVERNHIAKAHVYADHVFSVLHAPHLGTGGHVHYIELDQFIGPNYLVTVHGPLNAAVSPQVASADTTAVVERIGRDEIHPRTPVQLSYSIVSSMIRRQIDLVAQLAAESGRLEREVTDAKRDDDPESLLEELFEVGHQLLAIRTMATHSAETYRNIAKTARMLSESDRAVVGDLADRFEMVRSMAAGQKDFVQGVIEFYQTRTNTHLALAAERLSNTSVQQNDDMRRISAWVAIIAVPTAVTGFFGQNVPYPGFNKESGFLMSTFIIVAGAIALYVLFKIKRWL